MNIYEGCIYRPVAENSSELSFYHFMKYSRLRGKKGSIVIHLSLASKVKEQSGFELRLQEICLNCKLHWTCTVKLYHKK